MKRMSGWIGKLTGERCESRIGNDRFEGYLRNVDAGGFFWSIAFSGEF